MESAEIKSTGDTTFLLEHHTPDPTPLTETKPALTSEANPIEEAQNSISNRNQAPPPLNTTTKQATTGTEKRIDMTSTPATSTTTGMDRRDMASPNTAPSTTTSSDRHDMVCPDPTAHRDTRLQQQASSAALYVTKPAKNADPILDANNKLSSRSKLHSFQLFYDPC